MEINFSKLEKKSLKFWKENKTFERSLEKQKRRPNFVFYEGPPTANAKPGVHHVLSRVFKDIICRYKTMQGFKVLRKAGWDTHGLPVELEVEKKLGLKTKKDIEKYGVAKFNQQCKKSVWQYKKDWEKVTERIGFWLDMKNPYITYDTDYIETVWWIIKAVWEKGLLYQDYKVVPYCPRCGTGLSSHELALGYKSVKEPAIYVKFRILNPEFENTSLLVWTTTPWTLPGNVAIAINPDFVYSKVKTKEEYLILAKQRIEALNLEGEVVKEFHGKELVGLRYEPPYPFSEEVAKQAYQVVPAKFVSLEEGTGLVHIAPAFGEEDMALWREKFSIFNFQFPITVDEEGKFKLGVKKWAGMFVKEADPKIIEDLKTRQLLFKEELYEHDYPFCWRCHTPLLYYSKKSWFIRMTEVKKDLIRNNQKINWIPKHLKEGRFGEWISKVKDWAISRERYWGTPLPIWQCQIGKNQRPKTKDQKPCNNTVIIGSKKDLLSQKFSTNKYFILRHGQTIYQTEKSNEVYPFPEKTPIGLTVEGVQEVKKAAKRLKRENIDLIYSSDLYRTKQTAQIVAQELNLKIHFDKRLRDINVGIYHGKPKEEYFREFPISEERFNKKLKSGENWLECQKRMVNFLEKIDREQQNKKILIISHGDPILLLEGAMKGKTRRELVEEKKKKGIIKTGQFHKLEFKVLPLNGQMELDFHRPYIDKVKFYCPHCGNLMERTPEVIDCWFDSGSMPFAQGHWPFAEYQISNIKYKKYSPPKLFPADYICEGIDQTRGWFYTLLAISTLLGFGPAYKNVISLGHVLDEKGEKMSKSKGNVVNPWEIIEKYGADATRWYFCTINQPGDSKLFSEKDVEETLRRFVLTLWNCCSFFELYDLKKSSKLKTQISRPQLKSQNLLDRWIISRLNELIKAVTDNLEKYDVTGAARLIEDFVINDLSLWYIRRSRSRFQKPKTEKELEEAANALRFVLLNLSKLTAPFIPFLSEEIYQKLITYNLQPTTSVHFENWPKADKNLIDKKLEKKMEKVREIVTFALAERAKAKIKVRQPLQKLKIKSRAKIGRSEARDENGALVDRQKSKTKNNKEFLDLIKEEINVKEIIFDDKIEKEVELDTEITPELKEEGIVREIIRQIQEMRKRARFKPKDKILVNYYGPAELTKILEKNKEFILKEVKIKYLTPEEDFLQKKEFFAGEKEIEVDQQKLWLAIKKI